MKTSDMLMNLAIVHNILYLVTLCQMTQILYANMYFTLTRIIYILGLSGGQRQP
jgi:hypothetical protein